METNTHTHIYQVTLEKKPASCVLLKTSIPSSEWESYRKEAVKALNESASLDGFRKGKIPESILIQKLGEFALLEEMAEIAVSHAYGHIIRQEKLHPLGKPNVQLTKIAKGNPLEFTLETAVYPDVKLPDYQKIAKTVGKPEEVLVNDEELAGTVSEIMKMRAKGVAEKEGKVFDEKDPLPELTDEFAKSLGKFESADEFKAKLREQIQEEKLHHAVDKRRGKILDTIATETVVELPEVLIEGELDRMVDQLKGEVTRVGGTFEDYLAHVKKTVEDIRKESRSQAIQRSTLQLSLNAIALKESISPSPERMKEERDRLKQMYADATDERLEDYVRFILTNHMVIEFLEKIADEV